MMRILTSILVLLLVLMLALADYWLGKPAEADRSVQQLAAEPDCQPVDRWCHAGRGRVELALHLGGPVTPLTVFPVKLGIEGLDPAGIDAVTITFEMQGMDMGLNRFELEPVSGPGNGVRYRGKAMLPVCVSGRVDWRARVSVATPMGLYRAVFDFTTGQRP
jgi:hypothetical protein